MNIQIISTTDYKLFKTIDVNRMVNQKHVEKLKQAIQKRNMLHLNPIIVDASHNVIDGQHRLQAAKELKLPVFYVVDSQISESDIAGLNSNKSNWTTENYVEYYAKKGIESYITVKKLMKEFPKINISTAIDNLRTDSAYVGLASVFKEGKLQVGNYDKAVEFFTLVKELEHYFPFAFDVKFLRAFRQCVETGEYNHKRMLEKVQSDLVKPKIKKLYDHMAYITLMEEIYNWRQQVDIANFRLTRAQRERIAAKKNKDQKPSAVKVNSPSIRSREKKFAENFLKENKIKEENASVKKIPVKIDDRTTIMVKPGTDIKALKKKFASNSNNVREQI